MQDKEIDALEKWLRRAVDEESQAAVARKLDVNQSQVSRWLNGGGRLRGALREAAARYVEARGIETGTSPSSSIGKDGADSRTGDDAGDDYRTGGA